MSHGLYPDVGCGGTEQMRPADYGLERTDSKPNAARAQELQKLADELKAATHAQLGSALKQ